MPSPNDAAPTSQPPSKPDFENTLSKASSTTFLHSASAALPSGRPSLDTLITITASSPPDHSFKPTNTASLFISEPLQTTFVTSMGQPESKLSRASSFYDIPTEYKSLRQTVRSSVRDKVNSFGLTTTAAVVDVEDNIFVPIQQDNILPQIPIGRHHPVPRTGIEDDEDRTLQTNKFYANAFLGNQDQPIWTHPYSLWWSRGQTQGGQYPTWGMSFGHIEAEQVAMPEGNPAQHYINPPRRQSLILSAQELGLQTTLTTDTHLPFSVNVNLKRDAGVSEPILTFPVVQGMSFITGGYRNATPVIQCPGTGFRSISPPVQVGRSTKYRIEDADGRVWLAYVNPVPTITYDSNAFRPLDSNTVIGPPGFKGTIQVAKNPLGTEGESIYDRAAGSFVFEAVITGTVNGDRGAYSLSYTKVGTAPLLMFVLPHHLQSLDPALLPMVTRLTLRTTTKGPATAVWADKLTFLEPNLPTTMGFGPWDPSTRSTRSHFSAAVTEMINAAAERDLRSVMDEKIPEDSMYYAGKTLSKFATIVWILREVTNSPLWVPGLNRLKDALAKYIENRQRAPLYYDDHWKGLVSSAGFTDPGADFGNTYYNDHHFHYGYFVYAAAVVGTLDPAWLTQGDNKAWVNTLVKDFAESDYNGRDYPFSRSFDWWHGHSWAKGLFESADGKDEESSSEDGFASFAVKMWGRCVGDVEMEKRGNLMLAIQARSFNNYFYLQSNNTNHPPRFVPNAVTGILFENKVDYATYFGLAPELIHGIHMLPLSPASSYLRPRAFVREEWDRFFSNERWKVDGGWRGVLMANLALIDPWASWEFFRTGVDGTWEDSWIDGGSSRAWSLVLAAGLGGVK
ncbi:glycoside hydrolase family 81 protein [Sporormia fimetaria CBS 119925]|uniref:glucan endo-1,3-beta-D-glucosidase n=1 Tax=Sporormia fimetaria CBS 119925 TaxID=1340428 RepID=A0A6A6V631_9PLEO|nr:glycoside hydrolase family 81 protein [Sporormia fimetaria CBS 119925]